MTEMLEVFMVAGLFILRIGLPLILLLVIGSFIERGYRRREAANSERPIAIDVPAYEEQIEEARL